jgi:hypothetical protein
LSIHYDYIVADTKTSHRLYTPHARALAVLYADIERYALSQPEVFVGTAGTVMQRKNASGFLFYGHQFYNGEGKKRERYVAGPVGNPEADATAEQLRTRIRELKDLVASLRLLGREGFQLVDAQTYATVASLHNHRFFAAGGMLIGSHAYGVVLNRLGIRAAAYATEDIDLARGERLAFEAPPMRSLLDMLRDSGIEFIEVPQLDHKQPATSFKKRGRSTFQVDLLAPAADETYPTIRVSELQAHATGLPFLGYLLAESQLGAVLAREGCCAVRVPLPERFAIHKLIVSAVRRGRDEKAQRDRSQAAVLCAALAELHPGALESAVKDVPRRASKYFRNALSAVREVIERAHPRAWEALTSAAD